MNHHLRLWMCVHPSSKGHQQHQHKKHMMCAKKGKRQICGQFAFCPISGHRFFWLTMEKQNSVFMTFPSNESMMIRKKTTTTIFKTGNSTLVFIFALFFEWTLLWISQERILGNRNVVKAWWDRLWLRQIATTAQHCRQTKRVGLIKRRDRRCVDKKRIHSVTINTTTSTTTSTTANKKKN